MGERPVILITGASSGIGAAAARLFGTKGLRVVLAARRTERLESLADEIRSRGGDAFPISADLTQVDQVQAMVDTALDVFGQVDILLNNAGFGRLNWLEDLDRRDDIDQQLQLNLRSAIHTTHHLLPHMIPRGKGHIINLGSIASFIAPPTYSIYSASKFGLRGFTQGLRREVKVFGIDVSGIYPGSVETEFAQHTGRDPHLTVAVPKVFLLSSEDVARVVYRVVKRPRRTVIIPGMMRLVIWLNAIAPGLVDWSIHHVVLKRIRGGG